MHRTFQLEPKYIQFMIISALIEATYNNLSSIKYQYTHLINQKRHSDIKSGIPSVTKALQALS